MSKEKRAIANNKKVGQQRYRTYKAAIDRIKISIEKGFYLEAISLCESLITDRLESRLNYLTKSDNYAFETLGKLQIEIRNKETNQELIKMMIPNSGDFDIWRNKRNQALHAMAKIADGDKREWENKLEECKTIALKGEKLRKEIFRIIDSLKK